VAKLSPALGREKSHEAVTAAASTLGTFDAEAVLNFLQDSEGVVGRAARFVSSQARPHGTPTRSPTGGKEAVLRRQPKPPSTASPRDADRIMAVEAIVALLAPTLGEEAADSRIRTAMHQAGVQGNELSIPTTLHLLERLAAEPGLVGIAARFAKARIILLR
jgi:hypothetical protein